MRAHTSFSASFIGIKHLDSCNRLMPCYTLNSLILKNIAQAQALDFLSNARTLDGQIRKCALENLISQKILPMKIAATLTEILPSYPGKRGKKQKSGTSEALEILEQFYWKRCNLIPSYNFFSAPWARTIFNSINVIFLRSKSRFCSCYFYAHKVSPNFNYI